MNMTHSSKHTLLQGNLYNFKLLIYTILVYVIAGRAQHIHVLTIAG